MWRRGPNGQQATSGQLARGPGSAAVLFGQPLHRQAAVMGGGHALERLAAWFKAQVGRRFVAGKPIISTGRGRCQGAGRFFASIHCAMYWVLL